MIDGLQERSRKYYLFQRKDRMDPMLSRSWERYDRH